MKRWMRDWWRGWSDADLENVLQKLMQGSVKPGGIIYVTHSELRAHVAYCREQPQRIVVTERYGVALTERDYWE
jgi:hypothetical protein